MLQKEVKSTSIGCSKILTETRPPGRAAVLVLLAFMPVIFLLNILFKCIYAYVIFYVLKGYFSVYK